MRILLADDDPVCRMLVEKWLLRWGHEPVLAEDGDSARRLFEGDAPPEMAILNWNMPGMAGTDLCRWLRADPRLRGTWVTLLTGRDERSDLCAGLRSGADEYLVKPFDPAELEARIAVGERIVRLRGEMMERLAELEGANERIRQLERLLSICSWCRKIRDEENRWQPIERFLSERSGMSFSHGICPDCLETKLRPEVEEIRRRTEERRGAIDASGNPEPAGEPTGK